MSSATQAAPATVDRRGAVKSTLWSSVESGGLSVLSFLSLIIYSRLLGPADFGLFAMLLAIIEMLALIPSMSFHDALVQRASAEEVHFNSAFAATLTLSVILVAGSWLAGPLLIRFSGDPRAAKLFGVMSFSFLFAGLSATITARHRRELRFRTLALRSLVGRLGGALIGIGAAFLGAGVWSLVAQQLMMQALGSLVLWVTSETRPRPRADWAVLAELTRFGASALGALFTNFAIKRVLVISAAFFLGTSMAGYINIAFRAVDTFWTLTVTAIAQVSLPILSRLQHDLDRLRRAYREAVTSSAILIYPAFVGLAATAPEAVQILFGRKWLPAAPYVSMLGLLVILQGPRLFIGPVLTATGRPNLVLRAYLVGFVYLLIAIGVSRLPSPFVTILVWSGCEFLYFFVFGHYLNRAIGISRLEQARCVLVPFVGAMVMAIGITVVRHYFVGWTSVVARFAAFVILGGVLYVATVFALDRRKLVPALRLLQRRSMAPEAR